MSEFKKINPEIIQAVQWTGSKASFLRIRALFPESERNAFWVTSSKKLTYKTLYGNIHAKIGDWIIQNELYPCSDDIFKKTYRPSGEDHCEYCKFDGKELRPCDAYEMCCFEWKEDNKLSQNYNGGDL